MTLTTENYDAAQQHWPAAGQHILAGQTDTTYHRAIQLGLKGDMLERFGKQEIKAIADITDFVITQKVFVDNRQLELLEVPVERIFKPADAALCTRVGIA